MITVITFMITVIVYQTPRNKQTLQLLFRYFGSLFKDKSPCNTIVIHCNSPSNGILRGGWTKLIQRYFRVIFHQVLVTSVNILLSGIIKYSTSNAMEKDIACNFPPSTGHLCEHLVFWNHKIFNFQWRNRSG